MQVKACPGLPLGCHFVPEGSLRDSRQLAVKMRESIYKIHLSGYVGGRTTPHLFGQVFPVYALSH